MWNRSRAVAAAQPWWIILWDYANQDLWDSPLEYETITTNLQNFWARGSDIFIGIFLEY